MKIFILLASAVCLLGLVQALPHPQDEELEGLEEDEDLVAAVAAGKLPLGMILPSDEEDLEDEESVAFFQDAEEDLVGAPLSYDAVSEGLVSRVKNQAKCASCVAFANMAIIEICFRKVTGKMIVLGEQQFIDCARGYQDAAGCAGAVFHSYLKWSETKKTLATEKQLPYKALNRTCPSPRPFTNVGATVGKVYYTYSGTEDLLKELVAKYSTAAAGLWFNAASLKNFRAYTGDDVFDGCVPGGDIVGGHAMAVVGYGTEDGTDYWLMKNSWGTVWGDKGYIKMVRGKGACSLGESLAVITCSKTTETVGLDCEEGNCGVDEEEGDE